MSYKTGGKKTHQKQRKEETLSGVNCAIVCDGCV